MALLPSSSSSTREFNYDVFLSCGTDDTLRFTGLLHKALCSWEILTFTDLEVVDEITPALEEAIQTSRIAIVVLSKNYASSSFCLDKLSKILDHFKTKVHPVFYQVDPDDVRMLRGTYGEAMAMNNDRIQEWTMALQQVANLPGWQCGLGIEYDHKFIRKIVNEVFNKVIHIPFHYIEHYDPGPEFQLPSHNVTQLQGLKSDGEVLNVEISIGKTTLSLEVHDLIAGQFEVVCFLENVGENLRKHGLAHLQEDEDGVKVTCRSEGISEIKRRLCQKKVLLILDGVDGLDLSLLVGEPDSFGPGSRVVTIIRDKYLQEIHNIEVIFEVNGLTEKETLDFETCIEFKLNQVNHKKKKVNQVDSRFTDAVNRVVAFASDLRFPVSLEAIGLQLCYRRRVLEMKNYLQFRKKIHDEKIQAVLEVSFDRLESSQQCVFLDIACCFKGYSLAEVQHILRAHYIDHAIDYTINALVDKSLIKISSTGELTLHESARNMGKGIVQRKSQERPEELSRLWIPKDILRVLEDGKGTDKIEIICLDLSSTEEGKIVWDGEGFKNMRNLKILIIKNAHFSQAPRHLPSSLRVLEWQRYPSQYLPPNFHPENLAICKLPKRCFVSSEIGGLLNKKPVNLDDLSFDSGEHSNEMLYVSCLPKSEEISVMV